MLKFVSADIGLASDIEELGRSLYVDSYPESLTSLSAHRLPLRRARFDDESIEPLMAFDRVNVPELELELAFLCTCESCRDGPPSVSAARAHSKSGSMSYTVNLIMPGRSQEFRVCTNRR